MKPLRKVTQQTTHVGDVICMDKYVGKRRVQMTAVVIEAVPGKRITWQMKAMIPLPVWL
jgi:hypothetical protein